MSSARIDASSSNDYRVTFDRDIRNCAYSVSLAGGSALDAASIERVDGTVNIIQVDEGETGAARGFHPRRRLLR